MKPNVTVKGLGEERVVGLNYAVTWSHHQKLISPVLTVEQIPMSEESQFQNALFCINIHAMSSTVCHEITPLVHLLGKSR